MVYCFFVQSPSIFIVLAQVYIFFRLTNATISLNTSTLANFMMPRYSRPATTMRTASSKGSRVIVWVANYVKAITPRAARAKGIVSRANKRSL